MKTRLLSVSLLAAIGASGAVFVAFANLAEAALPDGGVAPVIYAASVASPERHNELLETDLVIASYDADGIASYDYRFNRGTYGAIQSTPADNPTINYASTMPDTRYVLEVRAVDTDGWVSDWVLAADAETPSVPNLIVAGDSVASGYTRQWFTSSGQCADPVASYGNVVRSDLSSRLPAAWAPTYRNFAWAGAGVHSMVNGGTDSCGTEHPSQLDAIVQASDPDTWNIIVTTGAINSTNWGDVMVNLTKETTLSFSKSDDRAWCEQGVNKKWNVAEKAGQISTRVAQISKTLVEETNADLSWTSYYTVTGSRIFAAWTPIPTDCAESMDAALETLHTTIRSGLNSDVHWVDIDGAPIGIQGWGGWPHPNGDGQTAIGHTVADAIG
jgi:hypothetical protein